jgi:hypothetical protein
MSSYCDKFNITLEELLDFLSDVLDDLNQEGIIEEDGSLTEVAAMILGQYKGNEIVESFCGEYEIWQDCAERKPDILLSNFEALGKFGLDPKKIKLPLEIYLKAKKEKKGCVISDDDVSIMFDYIISLSRHAINHVTEELKKNEKYLGQFPLSELAKKCA